MMTMSLAPHPFTLRQLQYAVAVADARSFRRAAERCHVSQPSLSAQIAQLEGALGVRLFERDRRRVLLTPAGEELVERARRVLLEADDLLDAARRLGDPLAGTLRIGVIPTVSPYLLPSVTPALARRAPAASPCAGSRTRPRSSCAPARGRARRGAARARGRPRRTSSTR